MTKKGRKPKFENVEYKMLRVQRKVPTIAFNNIQNEVQLLINKLQSQALQKCANESLKN